jgi:putative DNA primase/helicase
LGELIDKDIALDSDASGFLDNIGNYNKVVSNEPVGTKKLYQDLTTCRLGVVIVRAYNSFISVPDGSEGLDRRMIIVPFINSPKTIDTNLSEELEAETAEIFAWCFSMSQVEMKQNILRSGSIQSIFEMSIERFEANNPEFRFLSDTFPNGQDSIKSGNLYQHYVEWCQKNQHKPKSIVKFAPSIQSFGCDRSKGKINGCIYYTIPNMDEFDVSTHLEIVNRQFKDICRDSSNLDIDTNRDSCTGQPHTFLNISL